MKKSKINLIIDGLLFFCLLFITGIGFLIRYVLIPGFKRNEIYGDHTDLFFLDLDRHEWGTIHLIISLVFIGLLVLHIILHWKMIVALAVRFSNGKITRTILCSAVTVLTIICVAAPFLIEPEVRQVYKNQNQVNSISKSGITEPHHDYTHELEIRGSMQLNVIAQKYHVPVLSIINEMHLSATDSCQRVGWLRKKYGFNMAELKQVIDSKLKN